MTARGVFVTGTDTGIGKTRVSTLLVRAQRACGRRAIGMKPVAGTNHRMTAGMRHVAAAMKSTTIVALLMGRRGNTCFNADTLPCSWGDAW